MKIFIPGIIFLLFLIPHFIWLFQNNFTTIVYAFNRTGIEEINFLKSYL